ncbi:MAG: CAP domain-containing protein [Bacillota bacterium]
MQKRFTMIIILILIPLLAIGCANQQPKQESKEKELAKPETSSIFLENEVEDCKITTNNTEVKSGAGDNYTTITTLNKNDTSEVLGEIDNWYVIRLENNKIGCIDSNKAQPIIKEDKPQRKPQPQPTPKPNKDNQEQNQENNESATPVQELSSMEQKMVELVNQARRNNDVPPIKADNELTSIARKKSADMVKNNYFSHYSPTYGSPFDMLDRFGVKYQQAGENIAGNSSVVDAQRSLMNSQGHKENILNPNYTHVGIGIKSSEKYGYIFTQFFISKPQ